MSLIEIQWKPADRQVRQFAAICMVGLPLVAWWWNASPQWIAGLGLSGGLLLAVSWFAPSVVKPLFLICALLTTPIGLVLGEVMMFLMYLTVFCPMAILFRMIGRDVLLRSMDRECASYWQAKQQPKDVSSYYRQS